MSRTTSPSTGRPYGLARVARNWAVSRATIYRHRAAAPTPAVRRPGPLGPCSDGELVEHIRQQILTSRFHGEGYRKIWARLRFAGVRTSPRRVRRLMGAHGLLAPHRVGRPRTRVHDGTIVTEAVNVMWGTDMTETITVAEGVARVFIAVDHANSEVVGIHASKSGNRFEALEPIRQGVLRHFGSIGPGVAAGLKLRHDHGSNYMSGDFQAETKCLGITSSPSFVREPEGNGVAERFIRTLKENFLWVHTFDTIEELRCALIEFARHYNETWLVARHGHRTPTQVRADQLRVDQTPVAELPLAA
jgi:putative transposase